MKNILLTFLFCFFCTICSSAELLVKAKAHWQDGYSQAKKNSLSASKAKTHNARSQIGDIIVVRPNGWEWGKEEKLPNFYVIKIPNLSFENARYLEEALMEGSGSTKVRLKERKFQVPPGILNQADVNGVVTFNNHSQVINALIKKTK